MNKFYIITDNLGNYLIDKTEFGYNGIKSKYGFEPVEEYYAKIFKTLEKANKFKLTLKQENLKVLEIIYNIKSLS